MTATRIVCSGCGATPEERDPYPFRCPRAGSDDADHVMVRMLDPSRVAFPEDEAESNPFLRYRTLFHAHRLASEAGLSDEMYCSIVRELDRAVEDVDGRGFSATPFARADALSSALRLSDRGGVWVKDETGNVSGSHKGRHLMGLLIHLEVAERVGLADPDARRPLAIASCGNAALAAAVVARAGERPLQVFVPVDADPVVVRRLEELGAHIVVCPREPGVPGDPTYRTLQEAVDSGAVPFTCQGNLNGLAIEGGETIAYEMASDLAASGETLDHLVVQVGGGALASACAQGLREAVELGVLPGLPRIHTVQTEGAHPLERAYARVRAELPDEPSQEEIDRALRRAAERRSEYMWPWEKEPKSVATGILDDETYDWRAVVHGMLSSGGRPVVVDEELLVDANRLAAESTGIPVDATGSAGLAGVMALRAEGAIEHDDRVAVLFTGTTR